MVRVQRVEEAVAGDVADYEVRAHRGRQCVRCLRPWVLELDKLRAQYRDGYLETSQLQAESDNLTETWALHLGNEGWRDRCIVLVSYCCCNTFSQTQWLKTAYIYYDAGQKSKVGLMRLKSRFWQSCVPSRGSREFFPCLFQLPTLFGLQRHGSNLCFSHPISFPDFGPPASSL